MKPQTLLLTSNHVIVVCLMLFSFSVYVAYVRESELSIPLLVAAHIAQPLLAGLIKLAYVVRLVCQKQLGQDVR